MLYFRYSKGNEVSTMTTFNFVIICLFVCSMVYRFVRAIDRNEIGKACISGAEILMFAYLAKVLM